MATTDIEWCDKVWNCTRGCRRISSGCGGPGRVGGCYAEKMAYRFSGKGQPYEGLVRMTANGPRWTGVGRFVPEKLAEPLAWRKPCRIFVDSMSDLFFDAFTNEEIAAVFGVMAACPQHIFQLLTKRPKRMREWFAWVASLECDPWTECHAAALARDDDQSTIHRKSGGIDMRPWPLPNAHLGVSCENQDAADERIPVLLQTPAVVRWVSAEPLLDALDFCRIRDGSWHDSEGADLYNALTGTAYWSNGDHGIGYGPHLDWIVVGAESGRGARPADEAWFQSIAEQCSAANVPLFVKQMMVGGELCTDASRFPTGLQRQEFPR